jgi:hypothetical protein
MTRVLVAGVVLLAALAAGDALRDRDPLPREATPPAIRAAPEPGPSFVPGGATGLVPPRATRLRPAGRFLRSSVVEGRSEVLSADAVARAFPARAGEEGPTEIVHLAVAPDGALVLAVRRFPVGRSLLGAIEIWDGRRLRDAWRVEPRSFAGGLGFLRGGERIVLFAADGTVAALHDRSPASARLG